MGSLVSREPTDDPCACTAAGRCRRDPWGPTPGNLAETVGRVHQDALNQGD
jgi:hypothetical protein